MIKNKRQLIEYLILVGSAVLIVAYIIVNFSTLSYQVGRFFRVLTPFYIGFGIAYVLNRPINFFEKKFKMPRGVIILATYLSLIAFIALVTAYVVPQIVNSSFALGKEISVGVRTLMTKFQSIDLGPLQSVVYENINRMVEVLQTISDFILVNLSSIFVNVTTTFMNVIFGIIISIYMLVDKHKIVKLFKSLALSLLGKQKADKWIFHASEVNVIFSHFLTGLIVEAMIVGVLAYIGMRMLGVKYAMILGVIIMCTNVIPYIGPFIGAVPAVTATLMYDPIKAVWLALFILVLQQFDGNFIGPRVMGNYIGMDPIWVILSITIGGGLWGVLGILLAIPTGAIVKITLSRLITKYDAKHHLKNV